MLLDTVNVRMMLAAVVDPTRPTIVVDVLFVVLCCSIVGVCGVVIFVLSVMRVVGGVPLLVVCVFRRVDVVCLCLLCTQLLSECGVLYYL